MNVSSSTRRRIRTLEQASRRAYFRHAVVSVVNVVSVVFTRRGGLIVARGLSG